MMLRNLSNTAKLSVTRLEIRTSKKEGGSAGEAGWPPAFF